MDVNNTKEYSSNSSGNKKTGSVFVVDPNPPGMDIVPPEDLFIYVKFTPPILLDTIYTPLLL